MENLTQTGLNKMEIYWLAYQTGQKQWGFQGCLAQQFGHGIKDPGLLQLSGSKWWLHPKTDLFLPSESTALPVPFNKRERTGFLFSLKSNKNFFPILWKYSNMSHAPSWASYSSGIWWPLKQSGPPWAEFSSPHWTDGVECMWWHPLTSGFQVLPSRITWEP